ncbi:MAG: hypothetical protein A3G23_03410 [Bacteroidetes bacterium RIFCSPLOWO2_12_FULL_37_12]|nr:MAG: hypothetical protein A3G23_03410 [Bacteroidetes bacterium RIFCSPLOWO2_12_FULL_37_12]
MSSLKKILFLIFISIQLFSCRIGKQNVLFRITPEQATYLEKERKEKPVPDSNPDYIVRTGDMITIYLMNNDYNYMGGGPGLKGGQGLGVGVGGGMQNQTGASGGNSKSAIDIYEYLVESDGMVRIPLAGLVKLDGLTLRQASGLLEEKYADYYKNIYVILKVLNRRVFILGETGQTVFYLKNEKTTLIELLTETKGISQEGKAYNIRIIRGDLKNPQVFLVDLTTIDGLKKQDLVLKENDIVYIEPVKKITIEAVKEIEPIISLLTSFLLVWGIFFRN